MPNRRGVLGGQMAKVELLVLQCQLWHVASSAERLYYSRPEPFFAPFAVPTVERAVGPELLFWEVPPR